MNFKGFFKDWTITQYRAKHRGSGFNLWIASGFFYLSDDTDSTPLVQFLGILDKWRLWCELKREVRWRIATHVYAAVRLNRSAVDVINSLPIKKPRPSK